VKSLNGKKEKLTVVLKEEYRGQEDILNQARLLVSFLEDSEKIRMFNLDKNHICGARLPDLWQMEKTAEILNLDIDKYCSEAETEKMRVYVQEVINKFDARLAYLEAMVEQQVGDIIAIFEYAQVELRNLDVFLERVMPENTKVPLKEKLDLVKEACFRFSPKLREYNITHTHHIGGGVTQSWEGA